MDNPITWFMSGNQITANVYLGGSGAPEVGPSFSIGLAPMAAN
jgi:hypothetical protein